MGDRCDKQEQDEKIGLMEKAIDEINRLRHTNDILHAKVETMDLFRAMLFAEAPRQNQGFSEDVAYSMARYISNANSKPEKVS